MKDPMQIITGMHRSGTSLAARLFLNAGVPMGPPDDFYRADRWNPQGYHEERGVLLLNIRLIHGPWGKFSYLHLPRKSTVLRRAFTAKEEIAATALRHEGHVVKDARFCLTLPAWREYGVPIDGVLVCLREPVEVVLSLKKRNGVPTRLGYDLWHAHYEALLGSLEDVPVHYLHYNRLLDPALFLNEVFSSFDFFKVGVTGEQLAALGRRWVDVRMNHFFGARSKYPEKVEKLWRELLGRHARQISVRVRV